MNSPIRCNRCGETKAPDEFHCDRSKRTGRATICKACVSARMRARYEARSAEEVEAYRDYQREYARSIAHKRQARYRELRLEGVRRYGGRCACCGEDREPFLTFDHVDEWGSRHRAADSVAASMVVWLFRNGYPQDGSIRLLCWNCNCARGIYGSCPHEQEIAAAG